MAYKQVVLYDSPIRYYRLGEAAGTNVIDSSLNAQTGTISGGVTLAQAGALYNDTDTSMLFDGSTGSIALPTSGLPSGAARWSIEAWVYLTANPVSFRNIVSWGQHVSGGASEFGFTSGVPYVGFAFLGGPSAPSALSLNTWHYMAGTFDGNMVTLYVDGAYVFQQPEAGNISTTSEVAYIGNGSDGGSWLNGTVDEVAIYNKVLTADTIKNHYNAGIAHLANTPFTVNVAGTNVFAIAGTVQFGQTIGKRAQASFTVYSSTALHFQQYQQVAIYDSNYALAFTGYIMIPQEQQPGHRPSLLHTITCCDQHYLADKRVVAAIYTNKTIGYIAQNIAQNILAAEGVTIAQIYDGPTPGTMLYPSPTLYPGGNVGLIPLASFGYCTVAQAFDELVKAASSSGTPYYWMIDQFKQLWVVPYTTVVNSTIVDGTTIEQVISAPTVTRSNPTYRNTQYLVGGVAQTVTQTEVRKGDDNTQSWTMGYALNTVPTISTNLAGAGYVTKTVGIKGVDTGKDFYWAAGDPVITQDSSGTKLRGTPSNDLLQVVYIGQYPSVFFDANAAQVAYQQGIDGTSGIVEKVDTDATLTSTANGLSEVSQLLTLYATQGVLLQFTTRQAGYAPGQMITVNLPNHQLYNTQLLISELVGTDQLDQLNMYYTISAVLGPYDISWIQFFSKVLAQNQIANSINVGVSQSVSLLAPFTETLSVAMTLNVNVYACPLPSTTLFPSATLFPC
jgi:hypothetical protein